MSFAKFLRTLFYGTPPVAASVLCQGGLKGYIKNWDVLDSDIRLKLSRAVVRRCSSK